MPGQAADKQFDYVAIGMSGLCVLHCTALPVLAAALPWIANLAIVDDWFHIAMLFVVVPVSLYALGRAWRCSGHGAPLAIGVVGLVLMVVATFEFMAWHSTGLEQTLTLMGAGILTVAHLINLRNLFRAKRVVSLEMPGSRC
ncbi:MerC domain-containing protein [Gammaproteobacteria bacterium AB-CW1]|uniref:MerC domain-containing protein n=1 Tax=Natronospira elongata TaxID=3110268 RepID=A0AAP6JES4_9GAMM|nr:MerC domain-containing protein [Gammaproteobacteria bacterium AB-CW1]